ncbi:gamma-glutamyltransferase [Aquincola sp. MAHUQ-54]|uniref:Gamma-glutamyltransferase n=1 Tax=Aquincola agrisoli TaxID=3119538 RepID=A0AAW9Q6U3_9BURK
MPSRHVALTLVAAAALAACGGGSDGSAASAAAAGEGQAFALAVADTAGASVVSLTKVSETRVDRTVFDYVFKVTVRNGGTAQSGIVATLASAGPGTTVIDGRVVVGDLAANASATPADTITLRQDRTRAFDPAALAWQLAGTPVRTVVFDPARCEPQAGAPYGQTVGITGTNMMVTSADVKASAAGCRILAAGGTASDAAIAVQAVLGVVEPFASGLAGGAVITYYDAAAKKVHTYDGLASSPANIGASTTTSIYQMAVASDLNCRSGQQIGGSLSAQQGNTNISGRATGVPGTLKVLDLVHSAHGKQPWNTLWDDAIGLAANGFPMSKYMYDSLYSDGTEFDDETGDPLNAGGVKAWYNNARDRWGAVRCAYKDIKARYCDPTDPAGEKPMPVGSTLKNPELAATMALVRDGGAAAFYDPSGPIVATILQRFADDKFVRGTTTNNCTSILPSTYRPDGTTSAAIIPARIPSLMAASDFANYSAVERKPLTATRFGMTIHTQPAPLFGGVVTLYSLGLLERKGVQAEAFNSAGYLYLTGEASRLANADRRNIVGDPAFSNINTRVDALLSPAYLDARAALINGTALGTVAAGTASQGIPPFVATDPSVFDPMAALGAPAGKAAPAGRSVAYAKAPAAEQTEDMNTTSSLAIVDGYGNALAMTTTINTHWGAHIEAGGMMLNNAMSNFSASTPGIDVNGYAANKRPRSSISPAIAFDAQGRVKLVWGSAGGGPIPDYIVKTFLGNVVYGMDIQAAINADNWSGQALGSSVLQIESGKPAAALVPGMRSTYGYTATTLAPAGLKSGLAGISVEYDANGFPLYRGAADYRRAGGANGY